MRRLAVGLILIISVLSCTACGSVEDKAASGRASASITSSSPSPSKTANHSGSYVGADGRRHAVVGDATVHATDQQGDEVTVTVGMGEPVAMASIDDEAVAACRSRMEALGSSAERTVAVPVHVTGSVTSSMAADVVVNIGGAQGVTQDGLVSLPAQPVFFAATYGGSATTCYGPDHVLGRGAVRWSAENATPGRTLSWSPFLVLPGAITPADRSGREAAGRIVIQPMITLSGALAQPRLSGPRVVTCSANDPAVGTVPYIAVLPAVTIANGCTRPGETGPGSSNRRSPCPDGYPSGTTSRDGKELTYDRQASVFQVACVSFGAPEGVTLSSGMTCAMLAAIATYDGPRSALAADDLCDADGVVEALASGDWAGSAKGAACGLFAEIFAEGAGVAIAGATAESGPAAAIIGRSAYQALHAGLGLACGGLFSGGAAALGAQIEDRNEHNVAMDVVQHGKCMRYAPRFGHSPYRAIDCAS
ncbi:MAG TPA: hypothetical protein VGO71_19985 [Baekduia sp.]|jgi:hypothetical protein|nr:hypothetical protein [Baekduia sp.]